MAGASYDLLMGGGMPSLTVAPTVRSGGAPLSVASAPHYGIVSLVLVAVLVLFLLDKAGFRFAVTAGKR